MRAKPPLVRNSCPPEAIHTGRSSSSGVSDPNKPVKPAFVPLQLDSDRQNRKYFPPSLPRPVDITESSRVLVRYPTLLWPCTGRISLQHTRKEVGLTIWRDLPPVPEHDPTTSRERWTEVSTGWASVHVINTSATCPNKTKEQEWKIL